MALEAADTSRVPGLIGDVQEVAIEDRLVTPGTLDCLHGWIGGRRFHRSRVSLVLHLNADERRGTLLLSAGMDFGWERERERSGVGVRLTARIVSESGSGSESQEGNLLVGLACMSLSFCITHPLEIDSLV